MSSCKGCNASGWRASMEGAWERCPCRTVVDPGQPPAEPPPPPAVKVERRRVALVKVEPAPLPKQPRPVRRESVYRCVGCPFYDVGGRGERVCGMVLGAKPIGYRDWQRASSAAKIPEWCPLRSVDVVFSVSEVGA